MCDIQKTALGESLILSGPMLLYLLVFMLLGIIPLWTRNWSGLLFLVFHLSFLVVIVLLPNVLFFSILKNKLNMEIETFLYGSGFLSSIIFPQLFPGKSVNSSIFEEFYIPIIPIALSFASLFYMYAALLKNKESGSRNIILFLTALTIVFFTAWILKDFEIIKQYFESLELNFRIFQSIFLSPVLFGLCAGYYAVYRNVRISLRNVAWTPFLVMFCSIVGILLMLLFAFSFPTDSSEPVSEIHYAFPGVCYFMTSFIISCLAGIICKHFKKIIEKEW
jgi:hypothetical protein